jgi:hypothetical protein
MAQNAMNVPVAVIAKAMEDAKKSVSLLVVEVISGYRLVNNGVNDFARIVNRRYMGRYGLVVRIEQIAWPHRLGGSRFALFAG